MRCQSRKLCRVVGSGCDRSVAAGSNASIGSTLMVIAVSTFWPVRLVPAEVADVAYPVSTGKLVDRGLALGAHVVGHRRLGDCSVRACACGS